MYDMYILFSVYFVSIQILKPQEHQTWRVPPHPAASSLQDWKRTEPERLFLLQVPLILFQPICWDTQGKGDEQPLTGV